MNDFNIVKALKAMADENRFKILNILKQEEEKCSCRLLDDLNMSQPTLSHHMKLLSDAGLINGNKQGKWTHYSINKQNFKELSNIMENLSKTESLNTPVTLGEYDGKSKLYLLSGFLGAGKTTILTALLDALKGKKVAVIQNEFGKVGIDGKVIQSGDIEMIELNRGSIFCSCLKLNFVKALGDLALMQPDYIFVESSGLGDPSNIKEILNAANMVCNDKIEMYGSIALVDGANFPDDLSEFEVIVRQIKHCNLAVITKVDLIDADRLEHIKAAIRKINDGCIIKISSNGNLSPEFIGSDITSYGGSDSEETTNMVENKPKTISLQTESSVSVDVLKRFLDSVSENCHRIKGFVNLENDGFSQVDVVGGRIDIVKSNDYPLSQIVFISKIGPAIIKEVFNNWNEIVGIKMELKN